MNVETPTLSHQLRQLRQRLGLSMRQVAEHADISEAYVSLLEANKRIPSDKLMNRLVQILCHNAEDEQALRQASGLHSKPPATHAPARPQILPTAIVPAFEQLLLQAHVYILSQRQEVAQQLLTEALPQFHQPIQLQILIAFLEAARGQWPLTERAIDTAQQAYDFFPEGIPAHTLLQAKLLMASLQAVSGEPTSARLKKLKARLGDIDDAFLQVYLSAVCAAAQTRLKAGPAEWQSLQEACEQLLETSETLSGPLLEWVWHRWIEALIQQNHPESLKQALRMVRSAQAFGPEQAELWFRQARIQEGLFQLTQNPVWQQASHQSLLAGLQKAPGAQLPLITQDWTQPIHSLAELLEATQPNTGQC